MGLYEHGVRANLEAIRQDVAYSRYKDPLGGNNFAYHGYRVHNHHMCTWGAMFNGNYDIAMRSAEDVYATTSPAMFREHLHYMEPYMADPWHVLVRFGRWGEILERPLPCSTDPQDRLNVGNTSVSGTASETETVYLVCTAFGHYAKGIANAALGLVEAARAHQTLFRAAVSRVPSDRVVHNVTSLESLAIAESMLCGEIDYRVGSYSSAFDHLRCCVSLEDRLPYDEPPGWMFPTRHALGALTLAQQCFETAFKVKRLCGNSSSLPDPPTASTSATVSACCHGPGSEIDSDSNPTPDHDPDPIAIPDSISDLLARYWLRVLVGSHHHLPIGPRPLH